MYGGGECGGRVLCASGRLLLWPLHKCRCVVCRMLVPRVSYEGSVPECFLAKLSRPFGRPIDDVAPE